MLWFAFILLSLSYWKQHNSVQASASFSCDLLSFYYLCRTGNNGKLGIYVFARVVICFHFTIFVVLETTNWVSKRYNRRCDLLSFYYLCRTGNNFNSRFNNSPGVVICFHFTIFVVLETTVPEVASYKITLWFAFILLSLSYWKQHVAGRALQSLGCDLLSFYYLCRTGNNHDIKDTIDVVICFHFTIFVVLETNLIIVSKI